jgi:hypothetical protein
MPNTRIADYYLGCLDGSIYIDLNLDTNNQIYLKRISFDGYGCCSLNEIGNKLDQSDSQLFINLMSQTELDQNKLEYLILKLIESNKTQIWNDALIEYQLIQK